MSHQRAGYSIAQLSWHIKLTHRNNKCRVSLRPPLTSFWSPCPALSGLPCCCLFTRCPGATRAPLPLPGRWGLQAQKARNALEFASHGDPEGTGLWNRWLSFRLPIFPFLGSWINCLIKHLHENFCLRVCFWGKLVLRQQPLFLILLCWPS